MSGGADTAGLVTQALVTGGGGFLGRAVVEALLARGVAVRAFARGDYPELRALGVTTVRGDLADRDAVDAAVAGCDAVFHVAALAGIWGDKDTFWHANVLGTDHVIEACVAHGVRRLIYTSSPSVVQTDADCEGGDESMPYPARYRTAYQATKAEAERHILAAHGRALQGSTGNNPIGGTLSPPHNTLQTVALRPRLIWGPGDNHLVPRLVARAEAGKVKLVGGGLKKVDTVYISDAAAAHLCALDRLLEAEKSGGSAACGGKAYFISSGDPRPFHEVLNRILAACDAPQIEASIPPWLAFAAGATLEAVWTTLRLDGEPMMTRFLARQLATANWYDISAARRDLGFEPAVGFEAGLVTLGRWWSARRGGGQPDS